MDIDNREREIDALKTNINSLEKAIELDQKKIKWLKKVIALLLLIVIAAGVVCYLFNQTCNDLAYEINKLQKELSSRNENDERRVQVESILSALKGNTNVRKFYASDSLVYVDYIAGTKYTQHNGNFIAGSLLIPSNFCEEFGNSPAEYGFFNNNGIKAAITSLEHGDFIVRSNRKFTFATNTKPLNEKLNLLENSAILSLKSLNPGKGGYIANLDESLANVLKNDTGDITFRFFFATSKEGLYVLSIVRGNKLTACYLVSNAGMIRRNLLQQNLQSNVTQRNFESGGADIEISLWEPDNKLNDESDFDTCVDIFTTQLLERSK